MAYSDLHDFVRALEKHGDLKRIPFEVDPVLEIAEFADRAVKGGGPALLFEKPKGSNIPVLINSFASARRMELALGVSRWMKSRLFRLPAWRCHRAARQTEDAASSPRWEVFSRTVLRPKRSSARRFLAVRVPDPPVLARRRLSRSRWCSLKPDTEAELRHYRMRSATGAPGRAGAHKQGAEHYRRMMAEEQRKQWRSR
jgi:hypothetical protein